MKPNNNSCGCSANSLPNQRTTKVVSVELLEVAVNQLKDLEHQVWALKKVLRILKEGHE